jgi:hypothetical protein
MPSPRQRTLPNAAPAPLSALTQPARPPEGEASAIGPLKYSATPPPWPSIQSIAPSTYSECGVRGLTSSPTEVGCALYCRMLPIGLPSSATALSSVIVPSASAFGSMRGRR